MTKSTIAALLSAFIIPGAGHFFLKKYLHASVLISASVAVLSLLISKAIEKALIISKQILAGEVQANIKTIMQLVSNQAEGTDASLINLATLVLFIVWLIGILDAYRIGRQQEKNTQVHNNSSNTL